MPHTREAAGLRRQQRRRQIDPGEDRRRQQPATNRSARQCLQQCCYSQHEQAKLQQIGKLIRRQAHLARDDQRIDHEDRRYADMLYRSHRGHHGGRQLL
jgi:hypothetical protein